MAISRRQFFRGMVGQGEGRQREQERKTSAIDTYVRTNLLPYDFALTGEQTEEVLGAVRAAIQVPDDEDPFSYERRQHMNQIVEETGIPLNTLLSRKRYAVLHLRKKLRDIYDELFN